jgi:hypothetical protein
MILFGVLLGWLLNSIWFWRNTRRGYLWVAPDDPERRRREHLQRHLYLHAALDELVADVVSNTARRPSEMTVLDLLRWSWAQCGHDEEDDDEEG